MCKKRKILCLWALTLFSGTIFFSCRQAPENQSEAASQQQAREINLQERQSQSPSNPSSREGDEYPIENTQFPRVQLPQDYQLVQLIDADLDLDRHEEQILVAQNKVSGTNSIGIFVADYDEIRNRYTVVWSSDTRARQRKGLQVTVLDTTGDHNIEIICNGITNEGYQTIDIFRRTASRGEFGLYFDSFLSLIVDGTIELEDTKRGQSYQNGLSNGASFPVITNSRDSGSERLSDIVRRTYIWRNDTGNYEMVLEKKVSGTEIEDRQLKALFETGSEEFEKFLDGPWLYLRTVDEHSPDGSKPLIHFNSKEKNITLFSGTVQEIYRWNSSQRFLANSLAVRGENDIIPFMRIHISVYVQDLTHIRLMIYDIDSHNGQRSTNTSWSGMYQKMGESVQNSFLPASLNDQYSQSTLPRPGGVYRSDEGYKIQFDPPKFTLEEEGGVIQGGFSLYTMGADILELKVLNNHGIVVDRRVFSFDYYEEENTGEIIRRLFLLPGKIGIHGFSPTSKQVIRYEQIEQVEEAETESEQPPGENPSS